MTSLLKLGDKIKVRNGETLYVEQMHDLLGLWKEIKDYYDCIDYLNPPDNLVIWCSTRVDGDDLETVKIRDITYINGRARAGYVEDKLSRFNLN